MPEGTLAPTRLATTTVDWAFATRVEAAEARAWFDLYAAAPEEWGAEVGLGTREVAGTAVLSWAATGRRYFSRTIGLGVSQPATEATLDEIIGGYEGAGISMFLLQSLPHCQPGGYEDWLRDRGLEPFDVQDRVIRGSDPLAVSLAEGSEMQPRVEPVTAATADEWAEFIQRVYGLDTGPWLQRLVGRPGWHPYVARKEDEIVAARTMYIGSDGFAWWGMDAPVPGLMTADYELDAALCEYMVADGLALGVRCFLADIEAPADEMDTPAYDYFGRLGFRLPYARTHWARI